jgi:transposase-like protein
MLAGDLLNILRSLNRRKVDRFVCPRCNSLNIGSNGFLEGWLLPNHFVCKDCGYSGFMVVELERADGKKS